MQLLKKMMSNDTKENSKGSNRVHREGDNPQYLLTQNTKKSLLMYYSTTDKVD